MNRPRPGTGAGARQGTQLPLLPAADASGTYPPHAPPARTMPRPLDPEACAALVASDTWRRKVAPPAAGTDGCAQWAAAVVRGGYGVIRLPGIGRVAYAHRVALVATLGRDLAPGAHAGHVCHDRAHAAGECMVRPDQPCPHRRCVRPDHLAEQTPRVNALAGGGVAAVNAARTHCPAGHDLGDPAGLVPSRLAQGQRVCRQCVQLRLAARDTALAAAAATVGLPLTVYVARHGWSAATARQVRADVLAAQLPLPLDLPAPDGRP